MFMQNRNMHLLLMVLVLLPLFGNVASAADCPDSASEEYLDEFNATCQEAYSRSPSQQTEFCQDITLKSICCKQCTKTFEQYDKSQNNVVETVVYVDPAAVQRYKQFGYPSDKVENVMKDEIRYFFYQVNEIYGSLAVYGLKIKIRLNAVHFLRDFQPPLKDGKFMDAETLLEKFHRYLISRPHYDAAILYTGWDFYALTDPKNDSKIDLGPNGMAPIGVMCNTKKNLWYEPVGGLVEMFGGPDAAVTTAHELGHILGSTHDQDNGCDFNQGNNMHSGGEPQQRRRWKFSRCSADQMMNYLVEYQSNNCLTKELTSTFVSNLAPSTRIDLTNGTVLCQRAFGNDADVCPDAFMKAYDLYEDMCLETFCQVDGNCLGTFAANGMTCIKTPTTYGVCDKGKCV